MVTEQVLIPAIGRFRDMTHRQTNIIFLTLLHNSPFGATRLHPQGKGGPAGTYCVGADPKKFPKLSVSVVGSPERYSVFQRGDRPVVVRETQERSRCSYNQYQYPTGFESTHTGFVAKQLLVPVRAGDRFPNPRSLLCEYKCRNRFPNSLS